MLKKFFAFILLTLTLSPFNAPFQPAGGSEQQSTLIESLSAMRHDSASRAVISRPSTEPTCVAVTPLRHSHLTISNDDAGFSSGARRFAVTGDYPLAAVLRL
jgi:hypothetical protein